MSAIPADLPRSRSDWPRSLVGLAAVLLVLLLAYRDTGLAMVATWTRSETFAHAFLVPPISAWLIWRRRTLLAALQPAPQPWILPLMAAATLAWLLGELAAVHAVTQLALVTLVVLAVPAVLGLRVAREILFPLVFLYFSVPIGEFLLPMLMEATADFTVAALQLTGVPVYREGLQFIIPSGHWSVVEACSGVRYLIASFMVGALFAYLNYRSTRKRWLFVGVSLVVPIVANWLRAYMIVMIGHLSNNRLAVGVDHLVYGWVFFGVVIGLMFFIGARWSDPDEPAGAVPAGTPATDRPADAARRPAATAGVAAVLLVLLMLPHAVLLVLGRQDAAAALPVVSLPERLPSGAVAVDDPVTDWKPRFVGAAAQATRSYRHDGQTVVVHIDYYRAQSYRNKLVGSENVLVLSNDPRWNRLGTQPHKLLAGGRELTLLRSQLLGGGSLAQVSRPTLEVLHTYWVDGELTSSDYWAKVQGVFSRIRGRGDDGAAVFFYAAGDAAGPALDRFVDANLGAIAALLQQTRAAR